MFCTFKAFERSSNVVGFTLKIQVTSFIQPAKLEKPAAVNCVKQVCHEHACSTAGSYGKRTVCDYYQLISE